MDRIGGVSFRDIWVHERVRFKSRRATHFATGSCFLLFCVSSKESSEMSCIRLEPRANGAAERSLAKGYRREDDARNTFGGYKCS